MGGNSELDRTKELLAEALKKNEELTATLATAQSAEDAAFTRMREDHLAEIADLKTAHESALAKLKAEQVAAAEVMKNDLAHAHAVQNKPAPAPVRRGGGFGLGLLIPAMLLAGAAGAAAHARFHRSQAGGAQAGGAEAGGTEDSEAAGTEEQAAGANKVGKKAGKRAAKASADGGADSPEALAAAGMSPEAIASAKLAMTMTEEEGLGVKAAAADLKARTNMTGITHMLEIDAINHPLPSPDRFSEYIRKNTLSSDGDPSLDPWGTPYQLDAPPKPTGIRSAGADQMFDTDDDIFVPVDAIVGR